MHIRDFAPVDQERARDLIQAGMAERWGSSYDPASNPDTDDIATTYTTNGNTFVVAESDDGIVVGTGALVVEEVAETTARIVRMSVDSSFRRQGIAAAIVADLVARAKASGMKTVVVATDTPWESAVALYES